MERDCENELSKLNWSKTLASIILGASVIKESMGFILFQASAMQVETTGYSP